MNIKTFVSVVLIFNSWLSSARADEARSTWMMITGGDRETAWWTVHKIGLRQVDDQFEYEGPIFLSMLLGGILTGAEIVWDRKNLRFDPDAKLNVAKTDDPQLVLERAVYTLFKTHRACLHLEFPVAEPYGEGVPPIFIHKPIVIKVVPRADTLLLHIRLANLFNAYHKMMFQSVPEAHVKNVSPQSLTSFWQKQLLNHMPEIRVSYSLELSTLFFSVPAKNEQEFYETCESILSGTDLPPLMKSRYSPTLRERRAGKR